MTIFKYPFLEITFLMFDFKTGFNTKKQSDIDFISFRNELGNFNSLLNIFHGYNHWSNTLQLSLKFCVCSDEFNFNINACQFSITILTQTKVIFFIGLSTYLLDNNVSENCTIMLVNNNVSTEQKWFLGIPVRGGYPNVILYS